MASLPFEAPVELELPPSSTGREREARLTGPGVGASIRANTRHCAKKSRDSPGEKACLRDPRYPSQPLSPPPAAPARQGAERARTRGRFTRCAATLGRRHRQGVFCTLEPAPQGGSGFRLTPVHRDPFHPLETPLPHRTP